MKEKEVLSLLERFYCGEIEADEAAEALKPAAGWDPEEPELPKRLRLNQYATSEVFAAIVRGDVADEGTLPLLAAVMRGWLKPASRLPVLEAMVAAYNREREEEELEAQVGPALTADIEKLCREAIDREVQKGVLQERARCLGVFDWLLSVIPRGWDFVRRYTEAARRKLESGEVPRPAVDWTGADVLPEDSPAEPERCEWPGCDLPALCRSGNFLDRLVCSEHFSVTNGVFELEPITEAALPERLMVARDRVFGITHPHGSVRSLTDAERAEVVRRWAAEPKLRLWKNMSATVLAIERKVRERLREERDEARAEVERLTAYREEAVDLRGRVISARAVIATKWVKEWTSAVEGDRSGSIGLLYKILTGKEP